MLKEKLNNDNRMWAPNLQYICDVIVFCVCVEITWLA